MTRLLSAAACLVTAAGLLVAGPPAAAAGAPELSTTDRLADRRFVVAGSRAYEVGAADGTYPATGWHVRGEMGGFWTPPVKLLDGLWFAVDGRWLAARSFTSGHGYTRMGLAAPGGNRGPSCDGVVSTVQSERSTFSLNTAVMAVAEGNYGRLGPQRVYTTGNARIQLDPDVWEMPGAMPEIAPSPDFVANIDRDFLGRSSVLQAWGAYGVLWPVVHQQLGVDPDLGRGGLAVVPQLPPGQRRIAGANIRLADGAVDVTAARAGDTLRTEVVVRGLSARLTLGAVLPAGARVASVRLAGRPVAHRLVPTARGTELRVPAGRDDGRHTLTIRLR
jgi:hypothetical protein